ncbi:PQQ-dependent sugar dehydrogenase [Rhodococcus sp. HNM0569]|uniref:PQQ-dependent sugar dehydrogenase n=1 Tax=Rhodococcus sp. HNM0569 TaxID=2716340 RepID=UPI00146AB4DD|nr:PQQ-dependent sugar dehydrogenase [Rhodococcus sp. HNM0569]NLU82715.1 PQQ-dependent sugar dehydrogenase [Rhodococcus sp. HNM0569]
MGVGAATACAQPSIDTGSLGDGSVDSEGDGPGGPPADDSLPALSVETVLDGLDHPWDVVATPDGAVLTGQREGGFVVRRADGSTGPVDADLADLYAESETGLMGLALAPDFAQSRTLYSCQGHRSGDGTDIRVVAWTADPDWTALTRERTVFGGIPVQGGRHGGCRVLAAEDGTLYIGTGDTASASVPQDPASWGGKVLHIDTNGAPAAGNPDPASPVYSLGHRNVQGLALQPDTGRLYGVEQGTSRDDEVNLLRPGGNYGYKPDRLPFVYDESVPMTDPDRVPGAIEAVWSSGSSTLATASGAFVDGARWGEWDGALAVGVQKEKRLMFLRLAEDGLSVTARSDALVDQHGRLRSITPQSDGSLLVTTDNGDGADQVLRVAPA